MKWSEVTQLYPTLCNLIDCSLPGSSIHGILQARILEWVAISFSRGPSQPRGRTQVSRIAGRCFNLWAVYSHSILQGIALVPGICNQSVQMNKRGISVREINQNSIHLSSRMKFLRAPPGLGKTNSLPHDSEKPSKLWMVCSLYRFTF